MDSMYETLLGVPLFAGATRQRISEILGKNKFHFLKYSPGETIVNEGDVCTHMKSVITGKVRISISGDDHRFNVSQTISAPDLITPDYFFGRTTRYPATVQAIDNVGIMQIDKSDFLNIITSDTIFLFNYLNLLSMNAQLAVDGVLALTAGSVETRIAYWIVALSQSNGKDIELQCRRDMHNVFGVSRQDLAHALDAMAERQIIEYSQYTISVIDRRKLVDLLIPRH